MTSQIKLISARRIWDSRGRPTVEVDVQLESGVRGRGVAPAGASRGQNEAVDLRDGGADFGGLDIRQAIDRIHSEIAETLIGRDAMDQRGVDEAMVALDGTPNRSRLGGNAMVATSMAVLRAAAAAEGLPLWRYLAAGPTRAPSLARNPDFRRRAHAGRRVDIQDFLVMPMGAESFSHALDMVSRSTPGPAR